MRGNLYSLIDEVDHGYLNLLKVDSNNIIKNKIKEYINSMQNYNNKDKEILYAKALYYYLDDDKENAIICFNKVLESDKTKELQNNGEIFIYMSEFYANIGEIYFQNKYFDLAEGLFIKEKLYYHLVNLYLSAMLREALKKREHYYIDKYLKKTREILSTLKEGDLFKFYIRLGQIYSAILDYDSAIEIFKEAINYAERNNQYDEVGIGAAYLQYVYSSDNRLDEGKKVIINILEKYYDKISIFTKLILSLEILEILINEKRLDQKMEGLISFIRESINSMEYSRKQCFKSKFNILICRKIILELNRYHCGQEKLIQVKSLINECEEINSRFRGLLRLPHNYYWIKIINGDICILEGNYEKALEHYNEALRMSYKYNIKYTLRSYDGIKYAYKYSGNFEKALSITKRMNSILKDIKVENEKKVIKINAKYNELKSYDRIKEQFFSKLSYDLKEPINSIYSTVQLIDKMSNVGNKELKEYYLKYHAIITKNCLKILKIINNLIDAVKIDANELKVDFRNYNIVYLVEDIVEKSIKYANLKKQNLVFDTEIEELIIKCDANLVEKIILSVLSNIMNSAGENANILVKILEKDSYVKIIFNYNGKNLDSSVYNVLKNDINSCTINSYAKDLSIAKSLLEMHNGKLYIGNKSKNGNELVMLFPKLRNNYLNKSVIEDAYNVSDMNVAIEFSNIIF